MIEYMINYQKRLEKRIEENSPQTNWELEYKLCNKTFKHLQQERLIHLLVMLTVGLATLITSFMTMINPGILFYILEIILIPLFFAYVVYYRKLENTAHDWYPILDKLQEKLRQ